MAAGLQRHVQNRPLGGFRAVLQGVALGVEGAAPGMPALADDPALLDDDGAHHRVGGRPALAPLCQLQGQTHIVAVLHGPPPSNKKCLERMVQGTTGPRKHPAHGKKKLRNATIPEQIHAHRRDNSCGTRSSFIPTVRSASEFHRIMPYGSWAIPPVGNCAPP